MSDNEVFSKDEVLAQVKTIIMNHTDKKEEEVVEDARFIDDLELDSLDNVEIIMAFEEKFGVEIPDDAADNIRTVRDAVDYIIKLKNS